MIRYVFLIYFLRKGDVTSEMILLNATDFNLEGNDFQHILEETRRESLLFLNDVLSGFS